MAYSRVVAVGDGSTTQFAVNFALDYLLEADVTCRVGTEVDGSGDPVYRTITFLSTNLIEVSGTPAGDGVEVVFERTVDKDELRVDYNDGDQLDEDNLMIAQKQAMMAVHEVLDGRFSVLTQDLDAGGNRITNVGEAVDDNDLVTKGYVDETLPGLTTAAAASAAAAAASQTVSATIQSDVTTRQADVASMQADVTTKLDTFDDRFLGAKASDPTTDNDGDPLVTGSLYWNTGSVSFRVYQSGAWTDAVGVNNHAADEFTGDGTDDPFTLSGIPGSVNNISVFIEGEGPQPPTIFSLAGDQLSPPSGSVWPNGKSIVVTYGTALEIGVPSDNSVGADQIAGSQASSIRTLLDLLSSSEIAAAIAAAVAPISSAAIPSNYLSGLTLSTAGSSATFGVAAGVATDSTNAGMMALASAYTKTTSAWAVGSGNGALDTGTIANSTWYHAFLIKRTDTGVVDVLVSTSPTSPTLPANYTLSRRIGSMKTDGSAQWKKFSQRGDEFLYDVRSVDLTTSATSTTASNLTLDTPFGVIVNGLFSARLDYSSTSTSVLLTSLAESDQAIGTAIQSLTVTATATLAAGAFNIRTDTSRNIRRRASSAGGLLSISTYGWIDSRGRS